MTRCHRSTDPALLTLARAVDGDDEALTAAVERIPTSFVDLHRTGPMLATRAARAGLCGPSVDRWRSSLYAASARRLELRYAMNLVGSTLQGEGVPWLPIKGMGLPSGVYDHLETRPTTDLDILIPPDAFGRAVRALRGSGWRDVRPEPLSWRFLVEEGYNWQAIGPAPIILELHFRLWGSIPEGFVEEVFERSTSGSELDQGTRTISAVDAAVLAGVHFWQTPGVRPLIFLYDLHRLLEHCCTDADVETLRTVTIRHGLQLFMVMSLDRGSRLWPSRKASELTQVLAQHCSTWERQAITRTAGIAWDRIPLGLLSLARLLSGRPSRTGWNAVWRSIWPHPGILMNRYPHIRNRYRRRLEFVIRLARHPTGAFRRH